MHLKDKDGVQWLQFNNLSSQEHLIHGFTTRNGGVSHPPFSSLNMGKSTSDDQDKVEENYNRILSALDVSMRKRFMTRQVHSDIVVYIDEKRVAEGNDKDNFIDAVDGLITDQTEPVLLTYYADCVPLFFYDPVNHVGGVVHSGWKGTSKQIGKRAVKRMSEVFGSRPEDILAGIGPSAGLCCYEVDDAVLDQFSWMKDTIHEYTKPSESGRYFIDLKGINKAILQSSGLRNESIEISDNCTMCQNDLLFSYRVEKPKQGRMAAIFALKEKK